MRWKERSLDILAALGTLLLLGVMWFLIVTAGRP